MSNCIIFFNLFQLGWGWGSILVHKTSIFKLDSDIYIHIYIIIYISIFIYRYMHVINYMYRYTTVFLGIYCLLSVQLCKHVILYNVFYLSIFPCTIFFNTETLVDNRDPWHQLSNDSSRLYSSLSCTCMCRQVSVVYIPQYNIVWYTNRTYMHICI